MRKKINVNNFFIYSIIYLCIIIVIKFILNIINLELMSWFYFLSFHIIYIFSIIGFIQLILKINNKTLKIALIILSLIILYIVTLFSVIVAIFRYEPTYIIEKDNNKVVAVIEGLPYSSINYYKYINPLMRTYNYIEHESLKDNIDPFKNNIHYQEYMKKSFANNFLNHYINFLENIYWCLTRSTIILFIESRTVGIKEV